MGWETSRSSEICRHWWIVLKTLPHSSGLETGTGDGDGPRRRLVAGEGEAMRKREVACDDAAKGTRDEGKRRSEEAEGAEEGAEEGEAIPNAGSSTWSRGLEGLDRGRAARPSRGSGSGSTRLGTDPGGRGEEFWAESPRGFETRPDGNGKRGGCWRVLRE